MSRNTVMGAFGGYYGVGVKLGFRGFFNVSGGRVGLW